MGVGRGPENFGRLLGPAPSVGRRGWPTRNTPSPTSVTYPAEFVRSRPNGTERSYGDPPVKIDLWSSTFLGHTWSSEPT